MTDISNNKKPLQINDISCNIEDISNNDDIYKFFQEKHVKYDQFYENNKNRDKEYWGIGIENESYMMFNKSISVTKEFLINNHKRERYSVDYWVNFKQDLFNKALEKLPDTIELPVYINGYLFQKTDLYGEPTKKYTKLAEPNPKFSGTTIDQYLKNKSSTFNKLFEKQMIYDGDTFEFTTYNFYKTNVKSVVNELIQIKTEFISEINKKLVIDTSDVDLSKNYLFKDTIIYPPFNYGFAKFLTNMNNLSICNNGTYHINITLPTPLNNKGEIENQEKFKQVHSNAIKIIQWMEPFLIALYGSPDIMHLLDSRYSGGSLRLCISRYIGLGTYDSDKMIKGKMLNDFEYKIGHYFNQLHHNSIYNPPEKIGYDFNYNKFQKHGIELRIFDYFPEKYLEDIINFIILLCQFSIYSNIPNPQDDILWNQFVVDCIQKGSEAMVSVGLYNRLLLLFDINLGCCIPMCQNNKPKKILDVMTIISTYLYENYCDFSLVQKMSPEIKPIQFVDYNSIIKNEFKKMLKIGQNKI
jgi:hypothetical protein